MKRSLVLISALVAVPVLAQNDFGPVRYDYVATTLALPDSDEIGIELDGSTAVTEHLVVFGRYRDYEPRNNFELESLEIGVGRILRIRPSLDFIPSMSYADNAIKARGRPTADEEGIILGGHVRGWMSPRVELAASVMLDNSRSSSTDTVLEFGMQFFRQANWSFGGRVRDDDEDTTLFLGTRFYFGASRRPLGQ